MNTCIFCEKLGSFDHVIQIDSINNDTFFCCEVCFKSKDYFLTIINDKDLFDFDYASKLIKNDEKLKEITKGMVVEAALNKSNVMFCKFTSKQVELIKLSK